MSRKSGVRPAEEHHGIIESVQWLLFSMSSNDPEAVLDFLRSWAVRKGDGLPLWHSKRFLNVFPGLPREVFVRALMRWLIEDRRLEESALHILASELSVDILPPNEILSLSDSDLLILILVLAGLDHTHGAARLLASLFLPLTKRDDAEKLGEEMERALAHAVANFPSLVERLPKASEVAGPSFSAVVRRLKSFRDKVGKVRHRAAQMPEIACPLERLSLYHRVQAESTGEAIREASNDDPGRTPFLAMVKKVNMLTGGQFFSRIGGRFTTPTPLRRLKTTVELAQLPILDPTAEMIRATQIQGRVEDLRRQP